MSFRLPPLAVLVLIASAAPAFAQRGLTNIPDPDPRKELERLRVADGFEINLFAADPQIAKPIQSNWDARGRLWVATSSVYPQLEPGETANDKIVILEDTTGDGVADKTTVFADGLLIPTGVLPARNGAYVANSTELLFMEDTDGDDKADKTTVVLSGFGTEDTHHILHTLRRGPGGYIYFNQSIYIHSNIETPWGPKRLDAGGVWRFRPDTLELDVWVRGFVNPWGHRFDDWGQEFVTDGAFGEGVNYVFPGAAFVTAANAERLLHGLSPGQPKHASLAILGGPHLPPEYAGTFATNDFRGNRVNRFELEEQGSGYVARQLADLIWTDHVAFRPVDISMGPDGAIYISDWYNPIIQHGEVDFRDPRRDKTHGRIWRITAKGRPLVKQPDLTTATPAELVAALKSDDRWTRDAARQLIGERGREAMTPALLDPKLGLQTEISASAERDSLEILWAMQSVNIVEDRWLKSGLSSPDHHARAAAVRVLADWRNEVPDARDRFSKAVAGEHPQVRLEAVNGLRRFGDADAVRRALAAADKPLDENLDYALWLTCRELQAAWLPEVAKNPKYFGGVNRLVFALNAAGTGEAIQPAIALWDGGKLTPDEKAAIAGLIGRFGGPADLSRLASAGTSNDPALEGPALRALLTAVRDRNVRPAEHADDLAYRLGIAGNDRPPIEADLIVAAELVGRLRLPAGPGRLGHLVVHPDVPAAVKAAALTGLAADGREDARGMLARFAEAPTPLPLRAKAAAAMVSIDPKSAAPAAAAVLAENPAEPAVAELVAAFLAAKGGSDALAAALQGKPLSEPVAAAALRRVSTATRKADKLADALRAAGGLGAVPAEMSPEQVAALIEAVGTSGDPHRGERLYRREDLQCVKCHAIGGAGGLVGPDMTSIGGSAQVDYLVDSLLKPSAKIKEGYHTTTVLKSDGSVAAGVLVRKTDRETVLRDANGQELAIPAGDIEEQVVSPVSLMPVGLVAKLRRDELADLVAFLSRLGKPGEFRVGPERLVRSWRVLDANGEVSAAIRANGVQALAREPEKFPWKDMTSAVGGSLPLDEVAAADFFNGQKFKVLRFALTTPQAGPVTLKLPTVQGLTGYVAGEPIPLSPETTLPLPAGTTPVTLVVEVGKYPSERLTVELSDAPGSPARAEVAPRF